MGGHTKASVTRRDQEKQQEGTQRGETVSTRDDEMLKSTLIHFRPRPFDASPGRKFSSTVAWRNKMKDEIPYQPAEKRIRPVSCPPTPRPRPKPEPEAVKSPRPKSTARVRIKAPEKEKPKPVPLPSRRPIDFPKIPRDPSTPKPFKCEGNCPVPVRKMSVSSSQSKSPMPPSEHHLRIDYDLKDSGSGKEAKIF